MIKVITWHEAPMTHSYHFEAFDRKQQPFAGKCLILTGDYRLILPHISWGFRAHITAGSMKRIPLGDSSLSLSSLKTREFATTNPSSTLTCGFSNSQMKPYQYWTAWQYSLSAIRSLRNTRMIPGLQSGNHLGSLWRRYFPTSMQTFILQGNSWTLGLQKGQCKHQSTAHLIRLMPSFRKNHCPGKLSFNPVLTVQVTLEIPTDFPWNS